MQTHGKYETSYVIYPNMMWDVFFSYSLNLISYIEGYSYIRLFFQY